MYPRVAEAGRRKETMICTPSLAIGRRFMYPASCVSGARDGSLQGGDTGGGFIRVQSDRVYFGW